MAMEEGQSMRTIRNAAARCVAAAIAAAALCGAASGQSQSSSLWARAGSSPRLTIADRTAMRVGDIVTVIVSEGQTVQDDGKLETSKSSSLDSSLDVFDVKPNAFNTLPALKYSSARGVQGETKYSQKGKFETRLTAVVLDVKPNGTLLIEGRRTIHLDGDVKEMHVRGLVRPLDIDPDNTVSSDRIGNAEVDYDTDGGRSRVVEKNWFEKLLDFIWPF